MIIKLLVVLAIVFSVIYLLYINGLATFTSKKALIFLGKYNLNKKEYSATFKACTGYVKRVLVFNKADNITFCFNSNLDNGEIKAVINNSKGETIAVLTSETPTLTLNITPEKYFLTIEFYKAYGNCNFTCK